VEKTFSFFGDFRLMLVGQMAVASGYFDLHG
jgi:hypothetical protein